MKINITKALLTSLVAGALFLSTGLPAAAHHSFTAFNMSEQKTVTGTVKQVEWTNPHIWVWIDV